MPLFKEVKMPKLASVSRFASIPIVEASIDITGQVYCKVRESNLLFRWYLSTVEKSVQTGVQLLLPAVVLFERPIQKIDHMLCRSLDVVEQTMPSIHLPPETMYHETRSNVMQRADPVKKYTLALMDSKMTAATARVLDRAITTADKYIDCYIPADPQDFVDVVVIVTAPDEVPIGGEGGRASTALLVEHCKLLNRKLKRRLKQQARVSLSNYTELMYNETKTYVMQRADSVKQLGTAVLASHMTAATVGALDRAITKADKYVDHYLPADQQEVVDGEMPIGGEGSRALAAQVVQHSKLLHRKLKRRFTRQALAEAKAIKEQINVLVYVAKLVVNDPVLAWQSAKELFASLSGPEPENQARPATVEELLVLFIREVARRVVHFINYTQTDLPRNVSQAAHIATGHLLSASESLLKVIHLDIAVEELRNIKGKLDVTLEIFHNNFISYLEQLAILLAGNEKEKLPHRSTPVGHRDDLAINGVN